MTYEEAINGVKVGEFIKRGIKIDGIIHVGANDGYEVPFYQALGIKDILCFEPLLSATERFKERYPDVSLCSCGLSDVNDLSCIMEVTENGGVGTTFLKATNIDIAFGAVARHQETGLLFRLDHLMLTLAGRNCIVVDTQGMELQVLKGFGWLINEVDCAVIECSREPIYEGEAPAHEVVAWMNDKGFDAITPIDTHDDILFVRRK